MRRRRLLTSFSIVVLALSVVAWAQDDRSATADVPDPRLPFEVERVAGGVPIFVLGVNRFTLLQLAEFVAGIDAFLQRAEGVAPGVQLVWRRDGLRGYLSVSTSPFPEGPDFLMTLRGEPVRTFEDPAALYRTMTRLGARLLAESPTLAPLLEVPSRGPSIPQSFTR